MSSNVLKPIVVFLLPIFLAIFVYPNKPEAASKSFYSKKSSKKFKGQKCVSILDDENIPSKLELVGLQAPVPREDRVRNTKGNCVWCSLELMARYAEIKKLYGIARDPKNGGDPECQGACNYVHLCQFLFWHDVDFDIINKKDNFFLTKYLNQGRPAGVCLWGSKPTVNHMLVVVHYDPKERDVRIIDNASKSLAVKKMDWDEFHKRWTGWAFVIFGDPDVVPIKNCPLTSIPVVDANGKTVNDAIPQPKGIFPF